MQGVCNKKNCYLALINRAGSLRYGRILIEVCTHDRRQESSHTDRLSSVNKMFIMWQTRNKITRLMLLVCTDILLVNSLRGRRSKGKGRELGRETTREREEGNA